MGNGVMAIGPQLPRPSSTRPKRNRLGAHGISGAECRPAVPATWRHQPPVDPERNPGRPSRSAKTYTSHCSRVTAALAAWFLHDQDPTPTSASLTVDRGSMSHDAACEGSVN